MRSRTLIVPGLYGSGPDHWQSWIEREIPGAVRVVQKEWDRPVLLRWANTVGREIDRARGPVWIVAHSFGCLASVLAAATREEKVAGALLVAPADPDRFAPNGFRRDGRGAASESISELLPSRPFHFPSILVASQNDPWMSYAKADYWAERWGSRLHNLGRAGHINVDSGFGPWPGGLALFHELRSAVETLPFGSVSPLPCFRGSLARN